MSALQNPSKGSVLDNNLATLSRGWIVWGESSQGPESSERISADQYREVGFAPASLLDLDFSGRQTRELLGERDLSMAEATTIIARGIGKPDLRYVQFPYDQMQHVLEQMGMPPKKAAVYIEMFKAINAGVLAAQEPRSRENTTPTSFETFVQDVFAPAYHGKARVA